MPIRKATFSSPFDGKEKVGASRAWGHFSLRFKDQLAQYFSALDQGMCPGGLSQR